MDIGLQEVYSPPEGVEAVVNICFVHGLFGGPWKSFSAKRQKSDAESLVQTANGSPTNQNTLNKKGEKKIFWPRELLPLTVENVRIFTFGYDADIGKFMGAAGLNSLFQHARNLLNASINLLEQTPEPLPIIFVAHSLGGLVVKQALNQSATSTDSKKNRVLGYTRGIIFLGTPHHGSSAATYGRAAFRLGKTVAFQSANIKLLTALERNSESLDQLSTEFCETLEKTETLRMWSFSEEKQVRFGVVGMQIVPADSARIRHIKEDWGSISGDHRQIAKYSNTRADGFVKVSSILKGWVKDIESDSQRNPSHLECLKTLHDADARLRVQGVHQVSQTNTNSFEWLFTEKVPFSEWLQDETHQFGPLFWITGRPGSGKSTLMRFALENKRTVDLLPKSSGSPMAYFFHLRGKSKVQKSLKGMLKELLYQLLQQFPSFHAQIGPIYDRKVKMLVPCEWDLESLAESFLQIPKLTSSSKTLRNRVFLFIDALDENENQQENETMMKLIKRLSSEYELTAKTPHSPVLKICLASRSWPLFEKELGHDSRIPSFAIHDFTANDIRLYASALLEEPLQSLDLPVAHPSDSQQLVHEITGRANGVFVWVRVVVDNLRRHITDGTSNEVVRKKILEYPEELQNLYEYTVTRIPKDYWQELEVALKVLFSSQTALTLTELYVITQINIGFEPFEDFQASPQTLAWLASRSGGLIEEIHIPSTSSNGSQREEFVTISSVQFIHQTVQDFVRAGIRGLPEPADRLPRLRIPAGHRLLAFACLQGGRPHPCILRVARNIFLYFRECERDWDANPALRVSYGSKRWYATELISELTKSFHVLNEYDYNTALEILYLFMEEGDRAKTIRIIASFPRKDFSNDAAINNSTINGQSEVAIPISPQSTGETPVKAFSTIGQDQPVAPRRSTVYDSTTFETRPVRVRLRKAIRAVIALNRCCGPLFFAIVLVSQNIYYPRFFQADLLNGLLRNRLVTLAAAGQRLAEDRNDRPRMLKKVLDSWPSYYNPLLHDRVMPLNQPFLTAPYLTALDIQPVPEVIWGGWSSPLEILATALPSVEITDVMLRDMVKLLLEYDYQHDEYGNIMVQTRLPQRPRLSLLECCAMFKGQEAKAWLQLLSNYNSRIGWYFGNIVVRAVFLRMGLRHEEEIPEMRHGIVFPGVIATASRGLSLRYLCQGFRGQKENHGE